MIRYPYTDPDIIKKATDSALLSGSNILQSHLINNDEQYHCAAMLEIMRPPHRGHILDIGSGVGGVADWMGTIDPTLRFTLLNISRYQLDMNPRHARVHGDMECLPFKNNAFDCAMALFVLGHGDPRTILKEALRVAPSVLVFDITANDRGAWIKALHYDPPQLKDLKDFGSGAELGVPDGGRFEQNMPGFWKKTGARLCLMRCLR